MVRKHLLQVVIVQIILSFASFHSYALEKESHQLINEYIARNSFSGFSLDSYLKDQCGMPDGIKEIIDARGVWEWLREGGKREDEPFTRSVNHFHNPLTDEGFSGVLNTVFFDGESAVIWAQNPIETQDPGGYHSWFDTREYFYKAMTSPIKAERDSYLAKAFRGLGQLMHLVTDMSVPEHTRDDGHYLGIIPSHVNYEKYVLKNPAMITQYPPVFFDMSAIGNPTPLASVPIANLFDTNKYHAGTTPDVTVNTNAIGLSEYTNANFLSPDTMFTADFPYPNIDSQIDSEIDSKFAVTTWVDSDNNRKYLRKNGDGEVVEHLAAVSFWFPARRLYCPADNTYLPIKLDSSCYEEYASKLLPRAIGYSADLLRYFFRGELKVVSCLPIFWENHVDRVMVTIKNVTPTAEAMANGSFSLILRYTPVRGNPDGSDDIFVRADDQTCASLPYEDEVDVTFDMPWGSISMDVYDSVTCMLVFRGELGNEKDAVIAKALKLGAVKFNEEWDFGLDGNYPWQHTVLDDEHGYAQNVVTAGMLIKDLVSYKEDTAWGRNESWVEFDDGGIPITPNSYLQFRVTDMSNNVADAYDMWQEFQLAFNDDFFLKLHRTGGNFEDMYYDRPNTGYFSFDLGYIIIANIYDLFTMAGLTISEPLYLNSICFRQLFLDSITGTSDDIKQHMEVDFIRIVEEVNEE